MSGALPRPRSNVRFVSLFNLQPYDPDLEYLRRYEDYGGVYDRDPPTAERPGMISGYPIDEFTNSDGMPVLAATVPKATIETVPMPLSISDLRERDTVFITGLPDENRQAIEGPLADYLCVCREIEDAEEAKRDYARRYRPKSPEKGALPPGDGRLPPGNKSYFRGWCNLDAVKDHPEEFIAGYPMAWVPSKYLDDPFLVAAVPWETIKATPAPDFIQTWEYCDNVVLPFERDRGYHDQVRRFAEYLYLCRQIENATKDKVDYIAAANRTEE